MSTEFLLLKEVVYRVTTILMGWLHSGVL